jgi:hypothetical protein
MAKKDSKPMTTEEKAAKAKKAAENKAAREAKAAEKAAKAAEAAAAAAVTCSAEGCENTAAFKYTYTPEESGEEETVHACDEHREELGDEFDPALAYEDWTPIEAPVAPAAPPEKATRGARGNRVAEAPKADRPYSDKRRAHLVQAIRRGGVVKLRGGKLVTKVEDLP